MSGPNRASVCWGPPVPGQGGSRGGTALALEGCGLSSRLRAFAASDPLDPRLHRRIQNLRGQTHA
eukprot:9572468-Alexandrium_andersonii.AAC.1